MWGLGFFCFVVCGVGGPVGDSLVLLAKAIEYSADIFNEHLNHMCIVQFLSSFNRTTLFLNTVCFVLS